MRPADLLSKGFDNDVSAAHRRLVVAMEARLPTMTLETKERYVAVLSSLVCKLKVEGKHLREIAQEMPNLWSEALPR
jgi:hypothetical protein